jgi:hypothetical protein
MKWTGEHGDTPFDDWIPCSGKATYARQLAGETNALLLTLPGNSALKKRRRH